LGFNPTCFGNFLQHPCQVIQNLRIGETDHPDTTPVEPPGAGGIVTLLVAFGVAVAIDLNRQPVFVGEEIQYEPVDGMLPPELDAAELFLAQVLPQFLLCRCQRVA
jgi:hypothetical protein